MNAPPATPSLEQIPITAIRVSMTQMQQRRRKRFDPAKLLELADSIKAQGVLQPILVRPVNPQGVTKFELVAGERRWIAADRAGLAHIDCNVRELSDTQVLEAQLVENLQREDVHPLEEAEGYRELRELKNRTPDELGALTGKSRAYVYARLKLLELCVEAREAMETGRIDASKGLLLARIKGEKLQKKALKLLTDGSHYTYRQLIDKLRNDFMANLIGAPFSLDDPARAVTVGKTTYELNGACVTCLHNSRNDTELQASFTADAHVCTDRGCFDNKITIFWATKRLMAEGQGRTVLTGDAAKAAIPDSFWGMSDSYLDLDAEVDGAEFPEEEPEPTGDKAADQAAMRAWSERYEAWKPPTYREVLAGAKLNPVLAEEKKGALRELVPINEAAKLLKAKGIELDVPKRQQSFASTDTEAMKLEREKQEERKAREVEIRKRVFQQVHAKWKLPLKRDDLAQIADVMIDSASYGEPLELLYPELDKVAKLDEFGLARFLVMFCVSHSVDGYGSPAPLYDLAKRLKIDPDKIKKEVAAEARAKDKPVADPATPAPKKTPKKKVKK